MENHKYNFPKYKRLLTKKDYADAFKQSKKVIMPEFLLVFCANQKGHARLGLAFSKKYVRNATKRNTIKRVFRESFRLQQLKAVDIVACARANLGNISNAKLRADLKKAWEQLTE